MRFREAEFGDVKWTSKTQDGEQVNTIMNDRIPQQVGILLSILSGCMLLK